MTSESPVQASASGQPVDALPQDQKQSTAEDQVPQPKPEQIQQEADQHKQLGNHCFKRQDYLEAIQHYTAACETASALPSKALQAPYYANRSAAHVMRKDWQAALEDSLHAIQLDPQHSKSYSRAAKCHVNAGHFDQAIAVLKSHPNPYAIGQEITDTMRQQMQFTRASDIKDSDPQRAMLMCDSLLRESPDCMPALLLRCELQLKTRQFDSAKKTANTLYALDPRSPAVLMLRGDVCYHTNANELAKQHYKQVLQNDPDNAKARIAFKRINLLESTKAEGNDLFKSGDSEGAIAKYTECLAIDPENASYCAMIHNNRAAAHIKLSNWQQAVDDCTASIERAPESSKAFLRRATAYEQLAATNADSWQEVVRDLEAALRLEGGENRELTQKIKAAKLSLKKAKRKDYYSILDLAPDCDEAAIKKGYRKAALKWHPDKNSETEETRHAAEMKFKDVTEANEVLSDPAKRRRYDQGADLEEIEQGSGHGHSHGGMNQADLFQAFFAQRQGGMGGGGFRFG